MSLFRGLAASSHEQGNRRQLVEMSYIARVRMHKLISKKLIV
jgi:hypothetical protein